MGHITFTDNMVKWLLEELQGNPQAPYFPIQTNLINGPDVLCDVPNTNYYISDMCKVPSSVIYTNQNGSTVNGWSVSSNLKIISSTANSINVTGIKSGTGTITATFQNGQTISKTITVHHLDSLPIPSGRLYVRSVNCYYDGALRINFTPNIPFGGVITLNPSVLPHPLRSQTQEIEVKYTNPCTGQFTTNVITFEYQAPNCRGAKMKSDKSFYIIYPNPSNDIVNIDLRYEDNQPVEGAKISGELFDMMRRSKSNIRFIDNKATLSVKGLNKGIYVLKIYINDQVESHQIAVE